MRAIVTSSAPSALTSSTPTHGPRAQPPDDKIVWRPTPLRALELAEIPSDLHFVRDHFPAPECRPWSLEITASRRCLESPSVELGLERLRGLPQRTLRVVLECAGHRRVEFERLSTGLPWAAGAVAEARWTGPSLRSVLDLVGIPTDAREVVLEGADSGPVEGVDGIHHFARGLPLAKALDPDVLLACEMNGQPIPHERGGPVRAVVPGWYATDSVKWLRRIWFADREFDGFFQAQDYRFRLPDEHGAGQRMTELPVHALITTAGTDAQAATGHLSIRGIAWGGTGGIADVLVRVDDGPWARAHLGRIRGSHARVSWEAHRTVAPGPHRIACRAIDGTGRTQPDRPLANVQGYGNNAIHRVTITAGR